MTSVRSFAELIATLDCCLEVTGGKVHTVIDMTRDASIQISQFWVEDYRDDKTKIIGCRFYCVFYLVHPNLSGQKVSRNADMSFLWRLHVCTSSTSENAPQKEMPALNDNC